MIDYLPCGLTPCHARSILEKRPTGVGYWNSRSSQYSKLPDKIYTISLHVVMIELADYDAKERQLMVMPGEINPTQTSQEPDAEKTATASNDEESGGTYSFSFSFDYWWVIVLVMIVCSSAEQISHDYFKHSCPGVVAGAKS